MSAICPDCGLPAVPETLGACRKQKAREAWAEKDWRWLAALIGLVFVFLAFTAGRIAETNQAIRVAQELMAERQPHLEKDALEKAKGEVMEWFEKTWPCKGMGLSGGSFECVLREKRTP